MQEPGNQLTIESLMTAPLVAASKANVVMTTGQTRALLETCFRQKDGDTYEPIMVNMSLTRAFLEPAGDGTEAALQPVTMMFAVPLLCLVPINHLAVSTVDVKFNLEITAVAPKPQRALLGNIDPVVNHKAVLLARMARAPGGTGDGQGQQASHLNVNIHAEPLPLPPGLLAVMDLYVKAIQPSGLAPAPQTITKTR